MLDGYEYQKRKKRELKEWKEKNKTPVDYTYMSVGLVIAFGFAVVFALVIASSMSHKDNRNDCEKIDGEYIIVDKQGKTNIYGCVK